MDGEPGEPGGEAAHVGFEGPFDFGDGVHAADGGHVAFVEVAEGVGAACRLRSAAMILAAWSPICMAGWATPGT